jgi:NAD(P)-dependent dehydrogenase (short-subunit alcohol dehydrogenase family)
LAVMWGMLSTIWPSGRAENRIVDIENKRVLVLGGYGLVGMAVCRALLPHRPGSLIVGSLRPGEAKQAVEELSHEYPGLPTQLRPAWGDLLLRSEWQTQGEGSHPRVAVLADTVSRRRLVADILDELDDEILHASLLYRLIVGDAPGLDGQGADVVVDCVNTATAVAYQNIFQTASRLQNRISSGQATDWPEEVERLLCSLYVPQLVRHMQIYYEAMRRAGTQAYIKVGTSGTGGMGFNIPYTHGEERPSRVLLSKSAVAGAQTMLIFLLARTPGGPAIVKEIKPTAAIAWKGIGFGEIRRGGQPFNLYDCPPEAAVSLDADGALAPQGSFGRDTGEVLKSVYIDTGENGLFAAGEFSAITTLGQMEFITPEEIAEAVVAELRGGNTGRDVTAGLDSSVMGPSYRAGYMRQAALARLKQLEVEHGVDSVAFEILGPPRLSKLLFEAHLLRRCCHSLAEVAGFSAEQLSAKLMAEISSQAKLRREIISIGIPILMPDGHHLLRGPVIKSATANQGWLDLTPANMAHWQERIAALQVAIQVSHEGETSSRLDRSYAAMLEWDGKDSFDIGGIAGWLFIHEEQGKRGKS